MPGTPLPDVVLYGRPGCHLCDDARAIVVALLAERATHGLPAARLVDRDIESDPEWHHAFLASIPVIEIGDRRLELVTSAARIRRLLEDALDGEPAPTSR
jgi:hypothetical protein